MNQTPQINKSSSYKGVYFDTERGKWRAQIGTNMTNKFLGRFDTEEEAALAYNKKRLNYLENLRN